MTYQTKLFSTDTPDVCIVTGNNMLVLVHPSDHPTGVEAAERKTGRLREIKDRRIEREGALTT